MRKWNEARHQVTIAGKVTYAGTGRNIPGATVRVTGPTLAETRTALDGLFYFLDLPNGSYTVEASIPGAVSRFAPEKRQAEVSRDDSGRIRVALVEIALTGTSVQGRIAAKGRKAGLAMAEVRIRGSGEKVFSDVQGRYVLAGIEPGRRTVLVSANGFKPASQLVTLNEPGAIETLNFDLLPAAG